MAANCDECTEHDHAESEAELQRLRCEIAGGCAQRESEENGRPVEKFAADRDDEGAPLLIDTHGTAVAEIVWALFRRTIARTGPRPTLIEWDNEVPAFAVLAAEAGRAQTVLSAERMRRLRRSREETNGGSRHGPNGRFANQVQPLAA